MPPLTPRRWLRVLTEQRWASADRLYREERARDPGARLLEEAALNGVGCLLLAGKRAADAVAVFKLAAEAYPQSSNAHDSLAEAAETAAEKALARWESERALETLQADRKLTDATRQGIMKAAQERPKRLGAR